MRISSLQRKNHGNMENLDTLRKKINRLDRQIIKCLGYRMQVVERIGKYKKMHKLSACNKKREMEVLKLITRDGKRRGLNEKFVKKLYNEIFEEALRVQGCKK